ncbi:MAG TPA: phosphotransferase [Acidimicrobiales bacterium]
MPSALTNFDDALVALKSLGRVGIAPQIRPLTGGVSALVAVIEDGDQRWVVKVPLGQLSVDDEWRVGRERGANEASVLELLAGHLGPVRIPRLLFFDPSFVVLGEEFIEGPTLNYKDELLNGRAHLDVAVSLGEAVGLLHRLPPPTNLAGPAPRQLFDELRLDPYYRMAAERRPELRDDLLLLVADTIAAPCATLVHGDLTPKNVLITSSAPVLLDWEVIHVGDPAFDLGMMGAHFMLKALHHGVNRRAHPLVEAARGFWLAYDGPADLGRSLRHTGGVMIARLYGKSPVEYLVDESSRRRALRIGALALGGDINSVESLLGLLEDDERTER